MLYGSKIWCLRENDVAILRRAERSMIGVMCSVKVGGQKECIGDDGHVAIERSSR